ncbi:hypothetical protein EDC39_10894 [Geothermobacter ehrlichii]|uniref:Uncharacterized protein n=1 Tax=Geothermobacter ehrlichii TaxID=213224 RepID=A0A5D3WJW2_9BACT|nr:NusG domain II-containing protein [Geothermobacter ehrlichii]TYO98157.1 hypothetical protein EDC39_10894 [Geothermobacter ehrlichii]
MALKAVWARMTSLDRLVFAVLVTLALLLLLATLLLPSGRTVLVERDGRIVFRAPLDTPRQVSIDGPLGTTRLVLDGAGVRIAESPCPHKVCIGMGRIDRAGEWLACVPNHILVRVTGDGEAGERDYDLISR